ncbi:hypothetical protein CcCBS67573_g07891 [Chytriomyces confervae]|uniref:Golgi apparatus membrane protein tvp38 n=1 Tax=Chytriomyces confervae TaxID=246404 RepID=A0A507EPP0_9FUNG|nr:hypothetical protein CcCBS67573_g07891 [Chytriomyces confervae]
MESSGLALTAAAAILKFRDMGCPYSLTAKTLAVTRVALRSIDEITHSSFVFASFSCAVLAVAVAAASGALQLDGPFADFVSWHFYWFTLGVLSSIGLGTGLHTFMLFLGPHIVKVTLTAYSLGHLNFPDHGSNAFMPLSNTSNFHNDMTRAVDIENKSIISNELTPFDVYAKIALICYFWGFGTAVGELPPYFISRAAALAHPMETQASLNELTLPTPTSPANSSDSISVSDSSNAAVAQARNESSIDRAQRILAKMIHRGGFSAILLCAAVPNPFFDIAGMLCGSFGVPFHTFFGATVLGKAVMKTTMQCFMLVFFFSGDNLGWIVRELEHVCHPAVFSIVARIQETVLRFGKDRGSDEVASESSSVLSSLWNLVLIGMVGYFVISLLDSLAVQELNRDAEFARVATQPPPPPALPLQQLRRASVAAVNYGVESRRASKAGAADVDPFSTTLVRED